MLSGKAKIAGVIGWPVEHSLSPRLHNYWLKQHGIDGVYIPLAVKPEHLGEVIRALPKMGLRGVNLTIPHKELVVPLITQVDEVAKMIGAINTITIDAEGKLSGSNTDAYGFMENIRPHLKEKRSKAVVLGAGGAARAVCYALVKAGFSQVVLTNRTREKAEALAGKFAGVFVEPWERRSDIVEGADLLVNTTSLGLSGKEPLDMDIMALPKGALVTDIVYAPLMTPLLEKAKALGHPIVDGLGMLLHQAVPGFAAWFGVKPEVTDELRHYILNG